MKILVVGANGMIGNSIFRVLSKRSDWDVFGTIRDRRLNRLFAPRLHDRLIPDVDVSHEHLLARAMEMVRPNVVVNCAGITKHKPEAEDPLLTTPINALVPHRLAALCKLADARLLHISTDCVFSGRKGAYTEHDLPDATDVYGRSKAIGEVFYPNTVTLRTSTIGHELESRYGLLNWFLSQERRCAGYTRAIFSGLPSTILAEVIRDVVIPHTELCGLYHVAGEAISKYELLKIISEVYGTSIEIVPNDSIEIDRSLIAERFRDATGFNAPGWNELIRRMHTDHHEAA